MTYKIQGEAPFQVLATNFSLGPSNEGYTLQVSADGNDYSDLFTVAANTTRMVTGVASGSYYRMSGNNSEVVINWRTQCNDGGSGGGSGAQGPQGPQGFQGPAGGGGDTGQVQTMINTSLSAYTESLEEGDPIVGMAKQLYSPDGVTSESWFTYRTTAGDQDVTSGPAELRILGGEGWPSIWNGPDIAVTYTPSIDNEEVSISLDPSDYALALELGNEVGEYEYEYNGEVWVPELPNAIEIDGTPVSGAVITIEISEPLTFTPIDAQPDEFISTGLNNFDPNCSNYISTLVAEDTMIVQNRGDYGFVESAGVNTYALRAVQYLENGYVILNNSGNDFVPVIANEPSTEASLVDRGEGGFNNISESVGKPAYVIAPTEDQPYILFSVAADDAENICVHPRWSGIKDDVYEPYSDSRIDLSSLPRLYTVTDEGYYDYIDFVNGKIVRWVDIQEYDADVILQLEVDGDAYECDGEYIYTIKEEPDIDDIPNGFDNGYTANDFGVEFFAKDGELLPNDGLYTIYAETWYMNNLVDKLRRLDSVVVNLVDTTAIGERGKLYNYNGRLLNWNNGAGSWGEWFACPNDAQNNYNNTGADLYASFVYSVLPTGQTQLCVTHNFNNAGTYVVYDSTDDKIKCYSDTGYTTVYATISKGDTNIQANNLSSKVYISWIEGIIQFRLTNYTNLRNRISATTNSGHYEVADKSFANRAILPNNYDFGIPVWNKQGIVVGMRAGYNEKTVYFNNTGYSKNYHFLVQSGSNDAPTRMFVPTSSGEAGQILTSAGNAEPVWATMIKAVQITSAAYEALTVKDPNTLYLIVDE